MTQRRKKPIQYFFVDINDPDYYKRIKVARACVDCRKRKSKCDIGKPGSGPCSGCRKHNRVCEFTTAMMSSSPSHPLSSPASTSAVTMATILGSSPHTFEAQVTQSTIIRRKKLRNQSKMIDPLYQHRQHRLSVSANKTLPFSTQVDAECNWARSFTVLPLTVPAQSSDQNHALRQKINTTDSTNNVSSLISTSVTRRQQHHLVGHLCFDLPVLYVPPQQENLADTPYVPNNAPPLLSSHSELSSVTAKLSPPLYLNTAIAATSPWQQPKATPTLTLPTNMEMPKCFTYSSSPSSPNENITTTTTMTATTTTHHFFEHDLFSIYFKHFHPTYPVLPISFYKLRHRYPVSLRYAIIALALLFEDDEQQQKTISTQKRLDLAHDYYIKAWETAQSRGVNDLASVQTLLLFYKYHETKGEPNEYLLEDAQLILNQCHNTTNITRHDNDQQNGDNLCGKNHNDDCDEWLCRLQWVIFLHQFNTSTTATPNTVWYEPPYIRLPQLLSSEHQDNVQKQIIVQFVETINMACAYTSAMDSLALSVDDPWSHHEDNDMELSYNPLW